MWQGMKDYIVNTEMRSLQPDLEQRRNVNIMQMQTHTCTNYFLIALSYLKKTL